MEMPFLAARSLASSALLVKLQKALNKTGILGLSLALCPAPLTVDRKPWWLVQKTCFYCHCWLKVTVQ